MNICCISKKKNFFLFFFLHFYLQKVLTSIAGNSLASAFVTVKRVLFKLCCDNTQVENAVARGAHGVDRFADDDSVRGGHVLLHQVAKDRVDPCNHLALLDPCVDFYEKKEFTIKKKTHQNKKKIYQEEP